ncbi:NADP-dependent oxidoreductase domain-containing protein, partial [Mycena amicta]
GNLIDTANVYQNETSEMFLGEWMEKRNNRDQLVLATKYSQDYKARQPGFTNHASFIGNNVKSMHLSLEASLKKLRTSYIDIFYVHWWDWETSIEEVMNGLHNLVVQGKVLYLGVSDTPAWVVSQANQYARDHGKTPFVIYQGCWNLLERSFEREIIPMARAHGSSPVYKLFALKQHPGMALAPWNVLAAGKFRTAAQEEERVTAGEKDRMMYHPVNARPENKIVSEALEKVAADVGAKSIQAVAIAYILQKTPYCFPVIGGRKTEHLLANLEALDITLSKEQIAFLENAVPFDPGVPQLDDCAFPLLLHGDGTKHSSLWAASGTFVEQPLREPIRPAQD